MKFVYYTAQKFLKAEKDIQETCMTYCTKILITQKDIDETCVSYFIMSMP